MQNHHRRRVHLGHLDEEAVKVRSCASAPRAVVSAAQADEFADSGLVQALVHEVATVAAPVTPISEIPQR